MDLGNGGRSQRFVLDRCENIAPVLSVGPVDDFLDFREGHGRDLARQLHQLITIALRQHVGMKRHDLPQLHIGGPQLL